MFTGLINAICTVKSAQAGGMRLTVDLGKLAEQCKIGDSIAINGVCLTIAQLRGGLAEFDVSGETLTKSTLGKLKSSSAVNAELALMAADRFGGHFVLGHVDGTATIKAIDRQGQFADIKFAASPDLLAQMVIKGSVAVDGISLTIASMDENSFSVSIIPETLNKTTLGTLKIGDMVNIETDVIVKTIRSALDKILPKEQKLTAERLKELGF
ncbi:MAG: riboflavin synthase [Sedimentisphaerales bacterium]|nr:riboflavin synthase [Sedimentisphaerales bacterium]